MTGLASTENDRDQHQDDIGRVVLGLLQVAAHDLEHRLLEIERGERRHDDGERQQARDRYAGRLEPGGFA